MEDTLVASGSSDATIRFWDLSRSDAFVNISTRTDNNGFITGRNDTETEQDSDVWSSTPKSPSASSAQNYDNCCVHVMDSHIDEITALHFRGSTLVIAIPVKL